MTRISEAVECLESLGYVVTPPDRAADEFNRGKQNVDITFTLLGEALTPKPDPRADLVDLFEARAETHDDKSWIEVEEAVDLVMDREAEVIRAAKAEALREAADDAQQAFIDEQAGIGYARVRTDWLRARADSIERPDRPYRASIGAQS